MTRLQTRANRARRSPGSATPFQLWQIADEDSKSVPAHRVSVLRHAFIHAGYLKQPNGRAYSVCPLCKDPLP